MKIRIVLTILIGFLSIFYISAKELQPRDVGAQSYILIEADSQRVLVQHHATERVSPASITKLMTAYVVYQAIADGQIALADKIVVSHNARYKAIGSRMFLELGSTVSIEQLLHGLVIQSGNDAAIALAEAVAGTEKDFVELMNQAAADLGLKNSHFMNVTGLTEDGHYMSAQDIALLSKAIITKFPEDYKLYKERQYTWNNIKQSNRNGLLALDPSVDGLKTGHTDAAGYCLASSARRGKMRLIAVVLGTQSAKARVRSSKVLIDYGFDNYGLKTLYRAGQKIARVNIERGVVDQVDVTIDEDVSLVVRKKNPEIEVFLQADKSIQAPVAQGQKVGVIDFMLNGERYYQVPVRAMQSVEKIGFFKGLWRSILSLFE